MSQIQPMFYGGTSGSMDYLKQDGILQALLRKRMEEEEAMRSEGQRATFEAAERAAAGAAGAIPTADQVTRGLEDVLGGGIRPPARTANMPVPTAAERLAMDGGGAAASKKPVDPEVAKAIENIARMKANPIEQYDPAERMAHEHGYAQPSGDPQTDAMLANSAARNAVGNKMLQRNIAAIDPTLKGKQAAQDAATQKMFAQMAVQYGDDWQSRQAGPMSDLNIDDRGQRLIALAAQNQRPRETKEEMVERIMREARTTDDRKDYSGTKRDMAEIAAERKARDAQRDANRKKGGMSEGDLAAQNERLKQSRVDARERKATRMVHRQVNRLEEQMRKRESQFMQGLEPKDRAKLVSDYQRNQVALEMKRQELAQRQQQELIKADTVAQAGAQKEFENWLQINHSATPDQQARKREEINARVERENALRRQRYSGTTGSAPIDIPPAYVPPEAEPAAPEPSTAELMGRSFYEFPGLAAESFKDFGGGIMDFIGATIGAR